MVEQELEIVTNGEHKNLNLKSKPLKGIKGIEDGNHIVVEKVFAEGYEYESPKLKDRSGNPLKSYSCKVLYKEEEVTFWLNEQEHNQYKELGGVGDNIKINLTKESYVNKKTGAEGLKQVLTFEAV